MAGGANAERTPTEPSETPEGCQNPAIPQSRRVTSPVYESRLGMALLGEKVVAMRFESSVLSVSWIPSDAIVGMPRRPFDLGVVHYDDPPPDVVTDPEPLVSGDRVRFANQLRAWVEVDDGRVVESGYSGGGQINVTTLRMAGRTVAFAAVALPDLQRDPAERENGVTFVQTTGGRTGMPAPRTVSRWPFVQIAAPLAWTTLTLTIERDGKTHGGVVGASPFPRHWIYDESGNLSSKTGSIDFESWYRQAWGTHTPWGDMDSPAFATEVESALERKLSVHIMQSGKKPRTERLQPGATLVEQGQFGDSIFLLLDGVLEVEVDGQRIAEIGPGAILGERSQLEGGRRTSTLRALTRCRVAIASTDELDPRILSEIGSTHRREGNHLDS